MSRFSHARSVSQVLINVWQSELIRKVRSILIVGLFGFLALFGSPLEAEACDSCDLEGHRTESTSSVLSLGSLMTAGAQSAVIPRSAPDLAKPIVTKPIVTKPEAAISKTLAAAPKPVERGSFVARAVKQVGNAVVRIDTEKTITRRASTDPMMEDPFFRRFFGDEVLAPREEMMRGQGSGFLIDQSGVLLTNSHVVNGADKVTVTLKDGRKFIGKVRGVDEVTDLAVVKIEGKDLPVAPLGNSADVQVGDWAIAVGNPLGLDNTVTLGIVSTLKRSSAAIGIPDKRLDFIQTDAAINPGNSGGPLLNDNGEVIGINTAIRADAMGIGFAIPIDKAKELKDQLARGEKIHHPYLGVQMTNLTPEIDRKSTRLNSSHVD